MHILNRLLVGGILTAVLALPLAVSAHHPGKPPKDPGPGPHYSCFFLNGQFKHLKPEYAKKVHRYWNVLEQKWGWHIQEVPCRAFR